MRIATVSIMLLALISYGQAAPKKASRAPAATVTHVKTAPAQQPPSAKATIVHLARGKNAYVGHLTMAPGGKVPLHRDPTEEYIYIISGGGKITVDGKTHAVKAGSMVYMPAKAEVTFQNGSKPLVALQVFAGPGSADKYRKWAKVKR